MSWYDDIMETFGEVSNDTGGAWGTTDEPLYYDDWGVGSTAAGDMAGAGFQSAATGAGYLSTLLKTLGIGAGNEAGLLGGISGNTLGLGATGISGLLAALNAEPQVSTATVGSNRTAGQTTETGSPEWYKQLTQNLGTAISGDNTSWSDLMTNLNAGTASVADADLSKYINPYVQSVLNPQLTRMGEDFTRSENERRGKAGMIGAFGGSRDALEGSLATERFNKATGELTNNALSNAYTTAMDAFGKDRTANQWGTTAAGNLYGLLKPNTTTNVGTTIGDTQTTTTVGAEPNMWGNLTSLGTNLYQLMNPPVTSVAKPA